MERFLCIHGHFYQPPRENPWLETVEIQDSAYPYHDWNERITAECYAPNTASRNLDGEGRITFFEEKPKNPSSTLTGIALYYYPRAVLPLLKQYVVEGMLLERAERACHRDAAGLDRHRDAGGDLDWLSSDSAHAITR